MKKIVTGLFVFFLLLSGVNAFAAERFTKDDIQKRLPVKIDGFQFLDDVGLYEVVSGKNVFYMSSNFKYVIIGNVIDLRTQKNLTTARVSQSSKVDFSGIKDLSIKVGTGKKEIAVFSDPDCPYCKKFHGEIDTLLKNDYTVYIFLYPLESLHPGARKKSESIWCSGNDNSSRFKALTIAMNGGMVKNASCENPVDKIVSFANKHGLDSTPTLVFSDGSVFHGYVSAESLMQAEAVKKQ